MSKEIAEEYASSLADLTVNSKPLINMLTILAEENIDHAGVIVETVEKHLEKVHPDIKLPVLYLVDSIIKNVGRAYTQKFSQSIVNMFTRTFKQVDEKVRSQMFKLRETWHDVFPATKLYQLDVKVNLIDPAWPIQAQPQQSNIHVNPNFLKKPVPTTSAAPSAEEEEKMRSIVAKKEQELLMLQRKKIEMELEQARRQLELTEKSSKMITSVLQPVSTPANIPLAMVTPVPAPAPEAAPVPVKQRLGPPVNKPGRIAPVSGALAGARRDPRLARRAPPAAPPAPAPAPAPPIAPNVFDIKPLERVIKRKNVITIDVRQEAPPPRRRDPRLPAAGRDQRDHRPRRARRPDLFDDKPEKGLAPVVVLAPVAAVAAPDDYINNLPDPKKITKLPPIPKINKSDGPNSPAKKRKEEVKVEKKHRREGSGGSGSGGSSPEKKLRTKLERKRHRREKPAPAAAEPPAASPAPAAALPAAPPVAPVAAPPAVRPVAPVAAPPAAQPVAPPAAPAAAPPAAPAAAPALAAAPAPVPAAPAATPVPPTPPETDGTVAFKELKNYHKKRYMRRNKEKSESPESPEPRLADGKDEEKPPGPADTESTNAPVIENKDVDLRILHPVVDVKPAPVTQKRPSTELLEGKSKKNKHDKFDILFGNEDVDLRQLPQVEEITAPPPPSLIDSPKVDTSMEEETDVISPNRSPNRKQKDWNQVKENKDQVKKTPSHLDLVRAKLAEATKSKDGLGRPLLFSKSSSVDRERRRTISSSEDIDLRTESNDEFDAENHKKTISLIMSQAKEQYSDGQLDKNQYNTLMYQVLHLYEEVKLKEAKQRESLEESKRKLKAHVQEQNHKVASPKSSPSERNTFGDIDERIPPPMFLDTPPDSQPALRDSDMRLAPAPFADAPDGPRMPPMPPMPPMPAFPPFAAWHGPPRPPADDFVPRRFRGAAGPPGPFFRGKFEKRARGAFEPRPPAPVPPLPVPKPGTRQPASPLRPYERAASPPPLGAPAAPVPPTDYRLLDYIDQDPVKTIQIDGIPREIRFYGETAVIMMDWDDPREIKFLPGCRRVTFDNKDSVVLAFEDGYKRVEVDDQVFDIRFGSPTRELYIDGRWYECYFGGQPFGVIIDGKPRLVHLEGPLPQVDIGKIKRTDLVAGKINLIVNATQMCPVYLDAKVQKFVVNGQFFTIRFVDSLRTVLINEQPFKVEFGDLPKPIILGGEKYFIRFSALPRHIKPGHVQIANMEGSSLPMPPEVPLVPFENIHDQNAVETDIDISQRPTKTPSPEMGSEHQRLDMLASVMPSSTAPASASEYSLAEPFFSKSDKIPGLETPSEEKPPTPMLPVLANINVNDLFAKLVATGIVHVKNDAKEEPSHEVYEDKYKLKENKSVTHRVDLLRSETLKVAQPALVAALYGGMQCSGCGARFPPEHTVRYSQHLDWHFRQNRRERDSARRAHSRHWHYDLSDWVQYEEVEDLEEREKSWFETSGAGAAGGAAEGAAGAGAGGGPGAGGPADAPSVAAGAPADAHCALCGDKFQQFYNEDKEEWHLRNSVRHDDDNYHPLCFEDYKASLTKEEPVEEIVEIAVEVEKIDEDDEAIVIKDVDDGNSQSDNESVVEVVEEEPEPIEAVEIEEGDEDDVVFKAEPVEQVVVDDELDTDDETQAERAERDRRAHIDFAHVRVKQEPLDPDDEPIITAEEHSPPPAVDVTHASVMSSIDGNVQLEAPAAPPAALAAIRINISKALPAPAPAPAAPAAAPALDDVSEDEPLPPGEEPELEFALKPALEGRRLSRQPPVTRGNELSGLCSIM